MSRQAPARVSVAALAICAALCASCDATQYQTRRAPVGDPATPNARVDGIDQYEFSLPAGASRSSKEDMDVARVTSSGFHPDNELLIEEPGTIWDVRLQGGDAGVEVRAMTWGDARSPRCKGGYAALDLLLDPEGDPLTGDLGPPRQVRWERPLIVRGERVLSGRFERDPALFGRASVIDLLLVPQGDGSPGEVCVRVPVSGPDVEYRMRKRWSLGLRFGARDALPFSSGGALLVGLSVGRWIGPLRLGLEGIIGSARDRGDELTVFGFALETSGVFAVVSPVWRLGWSAAFEALWARDESRYRPGELPPIYGSAGGLRLGLQLLATQLAPQSLWRFSPTSACGFELFAAVEPEWTGDPHGSRVDFGVAALAF